jgi:aspartate/methionine/tyrosine aminotransferase
MTITSKLPAVGLTIFSEMTNLASACGAINLSRGFPEFDPHPGLKELVSKYIRAGLMSFYQSRRDDFLNRLAGSRFRPLPCHGTFFQMLDYSAISDEPDVSFARRLTAEHGGDAIPPSVFYHDGEDNRVLRFCFAKKRGDPRGGRRAAVPDWGSAVAGIRLEDRPAEAGL